MGVSRVYTKFLIVFAILTVLLIVVIFYFSFGRAEITITPKPSVLATDFVATIDTQSDTTLLGVLKGVVYQTTVETEKEFEAMGSKSVDATSNVIGSVVIYNEQAVAQPLIATTRLLTAEGVLLRIKNRVVVPAGGKVTAEVYADDPAAFSTLAPSKFTVPGLSEELQKKVYAESLVSLNSEVGDTVKVVKAADITLAKEAMLTAIIEAAVSNFNLEIGQDYTATVVDKEMLEESDIMAVDTVADKFTIKQKWTVVLVGVKQSDIVTLAADRVRQLVSADRKLTRIKLENLVPVVQGYDKVKKEATVKIHAEGETILGEASDIVNKRKLAGLSARGVELYLSSFDEIEKVEVKLTPFWVTKVPSVTEHISIVIQETE
jgi:hypothetical protein